MMRRRFLRRTQHRTHIFLRVDDAEPIEVVQIQGVIRICIVVRRVDLSRLLTTETSVVVARNLFEQTYIGTQQISYVVDE
jgi:hypothetical protein